MERFERVLKKAAMSLLDVGLILFSFYLALLLRFQFLIPREIAGRWYSNGLWMAGVYLGVFWVGGFYRILWQVAGAHDLARTAALILSANLIIEIVNVRIIHGILHNTVLAISALIIGALLLTSRICWYGIKNLRFGENNNVPLLVVGTGSAAVWAIDLCRESGSLGRPVAMVDDDPGKWGSRIRGIPVRGGVSDLTVLLHRYRIREVLIASPAMSGERISNVITLCVEAGVRVRILRDPEPVEAETGKGCDPAVCAFREVNTADFLAREEILLDNDSIDQYLTGNVVLVTGGGGSIGSELCRQIMKFSPKQLLIFDVYENFAYELLRELQRAYPQKEIKVLIGSIRDKPRLEEIFQTYRPRVVFHAAAHKHVPLMEDSPAEAVKNNIFGTLNLLEISSRHGTERFVQLSTDKAVNPTNVMGCTKRICEMLIQSFGERTEMKCVAVRFGNVLGSRGSVLPLFESQIKKGGPVTITHPDMVRYFMTIPEAARLVLQAGGLAESGSVYVLDMGKPVRIMELAEQLIRFFGYRPGVDIRLEITGLRPGEKMYEELLTGEEERKMRRTAHNRILVAPPVELNQIQFQDRLCRLEQTLRAGGNVIPLLGQLVPEYHPADEEKSGEDG